MLAPTPSSPPTFSRRQTRSGQAFGPYWVEFRRFLASSTRVLLRLCVSILPIPKVEIFYFRFPQQNANTYIYTVLTCILYHAIRARECKPTPGSSRTRNGKVSPFGHCRK